MSNPIKEILERIPLTEHVLGPELLDKIRVVINYTALIDNISDSYILLLLSFLADANLIELTSLTPVTATGKIYFIRKI